MGSLSPDRQAFAVSYATVTSQIHQTLDIGVHFPPEVTFNLEVLVDDFPDPDHFSFREFIDFFRSVDVGDLANFFRAGSADAENIGQCELQPFIFW